MRALILSDLVYTHTRRWAAGLASQGVEVVVPLKPDQDRSLIPSGCRGFPFVVPPFGLRNLGRWRYRFAKTVRTLMKSSTPDLLHIHWLGSDWGLGRRGVDIPLVVSPWGSDIIGNMDKRRATLTPEQRWALMSARAVLFSSEFLRAETLKRCDVDRGKAHVVRFGVDTGIFDPSRSSADIAKLLVGALTDWRRGKLRANSNMQYISTFRRDRLAKQLPNVLDSARQHS